MPENDDKTLLENLVMDADGLEKLEAMIAGFNLFEAIGVKSQEIRHSATLAFLLNPSKPHGLGDYFLRRFLKGITRNADTKIGPIDIDCADLSDAEVWCERKRIDILIVCKSAKLVIAVENKIYAHESSEQLKTYDGYVNSNEEWKGYNKLFVFLTIDGDIAVGGSENINWIPLTHENVTKVLEASLQANKTNIGVDQEVLIRHYLELMRRHILPDSDTARLARDIYRKHKQALDLIIEHRPDFRDAVAQFFSATVERNNFRCAPRQKSIFRFVHKDWVFSEGWCGKKPGYETHGVTFEINYWNIEKGLLKLELVRGNIPTKKRKPLDDALRQALGKELKDTFSTDYTRIWTVETTIADCLDLESDEFIKDIENAWKKIVKDNKLGEICKTATGAMRKIGAIQ